MTPLCPTPSLVRLRFCLVHILRQVHLRSPITYGLIEMLVDSAILCFMISHLAWNAFAGPAWVPELPEPTITRIRKMPQNVVCAVFGPTLDQT